MKELHLTAKDFKLDWFSGTGKGGQKRNKTQACCRITHIESGIFAVGQNNRNRIANQRDAFRQLASRIIAYYNQDEDDVIPRSNKGFGSAEVIRNYHAVRNEVHDKASGLKMPYKDIVEDGNLGPMIDARHEVKSANENR
jgi:protein subunit release factor A